MNYVNTVISRESGNDAIDTVAVEATTVISRESGNDAIDTVVVEATTVIPAKAGIHRRGHCRGGTIRPQGQVVVRRHREAEDP